MMAEFYRRVSEDVLSTLKVNVIFSIRDKRGISILGKKIKYRVLFSDDRSIKMVLMSGIIPRITERYAIGDREGRVVYGMIIDEVRDRTKQYLNETEGT